MLEQSNEVQVLSLEKVIETKLVQNNVTQQVLAALKEKYGGLRLRSLDDKEGYLEIKAAKKDCAKLRNLAVKLCKEGREDAVKQQKLWVAKEKEVVDEVLSVENVLDAEIERYDAERDRKEQEENQRREEAFIGRQAHLTRMGAVYSSGSFVLGGASIEASLIKEAAEDVWAETILPKFDAEYKVIEAERLEEERKKAEQEAELKRQREELARQQEEIRKQQEALRLEKERAEKEERERRDKLQETRLNILLPYNPYGEKVNMATLWELDDAQFETILTSKKEEYHRQAEANTRAAEERQKQQELVKNRCTRLVDLGLQYNPQSNAYIFEDVNVDLTTEVKGLDNEKWDALVQKIKPVIEDRKAAAAKRAEEKRQQELEAAKAEAARKEQERIKEEELRKAEELAQASDKVKYADLIEKINSIHIPEMRSGQYRKRVQMIREKINEILAL